MVESADNFGIRKGLRYYMQHEHEEELCLVVYPHNADDLYHGVMAIYCVEPGELVELIERSYPDFRATEEFDRRVPETIQGRRVEVFKNGERLSAQKVEEYFPSKNDQESASLKRLVLGACTLMGAGAGAFYLLR